VAITHISLIIIIFYLLNVTLDHRTYYRAVSRHEFIPTPISTY